MNLFTLYAKLGLDTSEYEKGIGKSRKSMTSLAQSISAKTVAMGTMAAHAIEGIGKAMISLGKSSIQASADIEAEIALYKQVFGELESAAGGVLEGISKDTNILATRLRGIGTSAFMQFKGAGVDAASALSAMDKYTRLAADAAAAFNISIEDADVRMRSFLRGNTEAGDAIGLFTSESQRNERAIATYGQKWLDLTEAQKQMLMLNVVDEIYAQQDILGQAAREGHSWENVIGNLSKAFNNLLGTVGGPFREKLIPVIEKLTGLFSDETFILRVGMLASGLGDIAGYVFDGVIGFIDELIAWSNGEGDGGVVDDIIGIATGLADIAGKTFKGAIDLLSWLLGGESAGEGVSEALDNLNSLVNSEGFQTAASVVAGMALAWTVLNAPLLLVGVALATIAARWDDIKQWAADAKKRFDEFIQTHVPEGFLGTVTTALETVSGLVNGIATAWQAFLDSLSSGQAEQGIANVQAAMNEGGVGSGIVEAVKDSWWGKLLRGGSGGAESSEGFGGGTSSGNGAGRGFATGLYYVPNNNYLARLHEGEAVLTKAEATHWRRGEATGAIDIAGIVAAFVAAVREALDGVGVYMGAERVGDLVTERVSRNIAKNARNRRYQPA